MPITTTTTTTTTMMNTATMSLLLKFSPEFQVLLRNYEKRLSASSFLSVCSSVHPSFCLAAWNNSAPTGRLFMKSDIWIFFRISVEKIQAVLKSEKNNVKTHVHLRYLAELFLEWEMFQTKVVGKIKTHILCSIMFSENLIVYETMWTNMVELNWPQITT